MADDASSMLQPRPRRAFDIPSTSASTDSSAPQTPTPPSRQPSDSSRFEPDTSNGTPASRTRSVLNLTSSTLFGIYETDPSAPSGGTGAATPLPRTSIDEKRPDLSGAITRPALRKSRSSQHPYVVQDYFLPLGVRTVLLFSFGVAYGLVITQLHDSQQVAPVQIESLHGGGLSWRYLLGWGSVGVLLGGLLPWVDVLWEEVLGIDKDVFASNTESEESNLAKRGSDEDERPNARSGSGLGADWNPVVRSIGAFIGIAFAIRRLPWQSTLQVSLTLALVNPVLWYLVDRSKPGFILSTLVGIAGTAIAFGVNPEIVPSPATPSPRAGTGNVSFDGMNGGLITNESIGVMTWISSVLFCSSVCFGNIGRRLALGGGNRKPSVSQK